MLELKIINQALAEDINIPNEPFALYGRLLPSYQNGQWSYAIERFDQPSEMCFPPADYNFAEMAKNSVFIGAYEGQTCIGLAVLQEGYFKYMELYDIKVNLSHRSQGLGAKLLEKAKEIAQQKGYRGLFCQAQDNNLGACLFYLKNGFRLGGLNTEVYKGTKQEGKADVLFYWDF